MRLKRLEIYGFKSFAERTVVVFDEGITGIVGPNGSGKSNLSDAVRWVLGEQSAKALRGGKMEDVIFNGTQKRKRMGYCEVSLVFDNEDHALSVDYTEVMITRRVYRSGEGEYYINKSACRLKDIVELFRDTGVGKEGYSIIGQGRIDEILSQKSEDRRGIFEEAAGIVKYRTRKEESEKRLANMRDNLSRVEDIIASPTSAIWLMPGLFIGFILIMAIKLRKSPFDLSTSHHAHQEMVKGITTEMSGPTLAVMEIGEYYEKMLLLGIVAIFFINASPLSWPIAIALTLFVYFIEILIDNVCARLNWKQVLDVCWLITLLAGGINILILMSIR